MSVVSRLSPLIAAVAVSGLLVAGPAYAQDTKPPVGSAECIKAVDEAPAVVEAPADKKDEEKTKARSELCSAAASGNTTTSTPATTTPTDQKPPRGEGGYRPGPPGQRPDGPGRGPGGRGPEGHGRPSSWDRPHPPRPGRPPGDRDCADFPTQDDAQGYFESIGGSKDNNADRLDANHNGVACEDFFDDGDNQDSNVSTTGDDNSSAKLSGTQVKDVPEGSAQTGGA